MIPNTLLSNVSGGASSRSGLGPCYAVHIDHNASQISALTETPMAEPVKTKGTDAFLTQFSGSLYFLCVVCIYIPPTYICVVGMEHVFTAVHVCMLYVQTPCMLARDILLRVPNMLRRGQSCLRKVLHGIQIIQCQTMVH